MDYLLNEQQTMIRDLCRQITDEKIKPVAAKYDESEEFPWEVVKVMDEVLMIDGMTPTGSPA